MEVYRRFRLDNGRMVERLVEVAPMVSMVAFVVEGDISSDNDFYYRNQERIAPQGNFENTFPTHRGAQMCTGGEEPRMWSRPRKGEVDRSWKLNRKTSWREPEASFRKMAPELAEAEAESVAFLAEMRREIISSFDCY